MVAHNVIVFDIHIFEVELVVVLPPRVHKFVEVVFVGQVFKDEGVHLFPVEEGALDGDVLVRAIVKQLTFFLPDLWKHFDYVLVYQVQFSLTLFSLASWFALFSQLLLKWVCLQLTFLDDFKCFPCALDVRLNVLFSFVSLNLLHVV